MITYEDSGVNPSFNDEIVKRLGEDLELRTGFADVKPIPGTNQFMAMSTDGVGTKLHLLGKFPPLIDFIMQDLVGMVANDIICTGAKPAYFQDYIGIRHLKGDREIDLIKSLSQICEDHGMTLTGGEMAEMGDTYTYDVPELVGFGVGFGNRECMIKVEKVWTGDVVIALESSGPHSNGFSLIRRILKDKPMAVSAKDMDRILEPTTIYTDVADLHSVHPEFIISMAHITGGGLYKNLPRAIPNGLRADLSPLKYWKVPEVFIYIQSLGSLTDETMWNTFNMGIGMCLIVQPDCVKDVMDALKWYNPTVIGKIVAK